MKNFLLAVATLLAFNLHAQTFNLAKNSSFDGSPSTTGWTTEVGDAVTINQASGGNPGGYAWLNHNGGATDPAVSQKIDGFKVGNVYVISGDFRGGNQSGIYCKNGGTAFAIDLDGKEIKALALPNPLTTWTKFSVKFTATATSHTIRLRGEINRTDCDVAIDNVVVQSEFAGWYRLKTQFRGDGECLEGNQSAGTAKGGAAFMDKCQNVSGQLWRFEPAGNGYYRMKTKFRGDGECFEGNQSAGTVKGGAAFMDKCQNVSGQLWKLVPEGQYYRLKTQFRGDGECLEGNQSAGTVKGGAAFMDKCQNVSGQLWKLDPVK
ncbi:MAG: carbohydrate binding domain-containing protein [Saprospiraceae bacterium]|nr:carbohydrate binding domain-containing protein [Saprospiraceae bacterium]